MQICSSCHFPLATDFRERDIAYFLAGADPFEGDTPGGSAITIILSPMASE